MCITHLSLQQTRARFLAPLLFLSLVAACSSAPQKQTAYRESGKNKTYSGSRNNIDLMASLKEAEKTANDNGRKVLATGRTMTLDQAVVVKGSCWDFINAVYDRSGFPNDRTSRMTVFKGSKEKGPYASAKLIQPGDWLYYVNHSYNGIEHSGIFVKWLDAAYRNALILSYVGEKREEPARYESFNLSHVYHIIRPADKSADSPQQLSRNARKNARQ